MKFSHRSTLVQVGAALVLGGAAVGVAVYWSSPDHPDPCKPATQEAANLTGSNLCKALRKADLPTVLGIPKAKTEFGGAMAQPGANGAEPSVHVLYTAGPYEVIVATHRPGSVKETEKVAGHSATLVTGTAGGRQLYNLVVSYDAAGSGFYSVDVLKTDGTTMTQDDSARLERAVAEKVLPTLPEWK
ncbi:DUF6215 domain-containing protein [Catenulispora subtropica]|uniref:DUF6215 domain-containing protein n=1 Tax=Catenulispora subtropica TaxID=450798 RepID=UPI0031D91BCC